MMKSTLSIPKSIVIGFVASVGLIVGSCINEVAGETKEVGQPYEVTYRYCALYIKGVCHQWKTGHETRVNTEVKGLWWDFNSYTVKR